MQLAARVLAVVVLAATSSACVSHIPLAQQVPATTYVGRQPLLVSVIDERRRVKDGKPRNFIGVAHGAFGIPVDWNVKTVLAVEDGDKNRDLAQFLQFRIVRGLGDKGWQAAEYPLAAIPGSGELGKLQAERPGHSLLLMRLNEWYFSINLNWVTAFNFDSDVDVLVFDATGNKVLEKNLAARDVVDEQASQSPQNHILMAYRDRLAKILEDPDVRAALGAAAPPAP